MPFLQKNNSFIQKQSGDILYKMSNEWWLNRCARYEWRPLNRSKELIWDVGYIWDSDLSWDLKKNVNNLYGEVENIKKQYMDVIQIPLSLEVSDSTINLTEQGSINKKEISMFYSNRIIDFLYPLLKIYPYVGDIISFEITQYEIVSIDEAEYNVDGSVMYFSCKLEKKNLSK